MLFLIRDFSVRGVCGGEGEALIKEEAGKELKIPGALCAHTHSELGRTCWRSCVNICP